MNKNIEYTILESLKFLKHNSILSFSDGIYIKDFLKILKNYYFEKNNFLIVCASSTIKNELYEMNIPFLNLEEINNIDLYISFIDEIDNNYNSIRINNIFLLEEKIIHSIAKKIIYIYHENNISNFLCNKNNLPILAFNKGIKYIEKKINKINGEIILNKSNNIKNNDISIFFIKNINFYDLEFLNLYIKSITGIIEHGFFIKKPNFLFILKNNNLFEFKEL